MKWNWFRSRGTWLLALDIGRWRITITGYKERLGLADAARAAGATVTEVEWKES